MLLSGQMGIKYSPLQRVQEHGTFVVISTCKVGHVLLLQLEHLQFLNLGKQLILHSLLNQIYLVSEPQIFQNFDRATSLYAGFILTYIINYSKIEVIQL